MFRVCGDPTAVEQLLDDVCLQRGAQGEVEVLEAPHEAWQPGAFEVPGQAPPLARAVRVAQQLEDEVGVGQAALLGAGDEVWQRVAQGGRG